MIYLDNNATTRVDPAVLDAMMPFLREEYANPSSGYEFARPARDALAEARGEVAGLLGAAPEEIVFTACGTESINAAIFSAVRLQPDKPLVLVSAVEHSACLRSAEAAAGAGNVLRLRVGRDGLYDLGHLRELLAAHAPRIAVASLMWANNETGVLPGIAEAAALLREFGVSLHSDAVQAAGKVPVDVRSLPVDCLSVSGHKFHAPKGVGALFVREGVAFRPLLNGGGHEGGRRAGTENVAFAVAQGRAASLAGQRLAGRTLGEVSALRDRFEATIFREVPDAHRNGHCDRRTPNTSNLRFDGAPAAVTLVVLDERGLCCSAGPACKAGSGKSSRVLAAMGLTDHEARESLRFSLSPWTTLAEVDEAAAIVVAAVAKVRAAQTLPPGSRVVRQSS